MTSFSSVHNNEQLIARCSSRLSSVLAKDKDIGTRRRRIGRTTLLVVKNVMETTRETTTTTGDQIVAEEAWNEDDIDRIEFAVDEQSEILNKGGAGQTMAAPDWMTQLNRLWGREFGDSGSEREVGRYHWIVRWRVVPAFV